jgi:hypothetical protein
MAEARVPGVLAALTAAIDGLLEVDAVVLAEGDTVLGLLAQVSRLELVAARQAVALEASPEWRDEGAQNGACWVTAKRGCPRHVPRRRLALGKAIAAMPVVTAAWAAGEIDPDHVAVLAGARTTSVAQAFARDEAALVEQATSSMFHVFASAVAYWRQTVAPDEAEKRAESQREQRRVHLSQSFQGMWFGSLTLDAVGGEILKTQLARIEQDLFDAEWSQLKAELGRDPRDSELLRTPGQRRADALIEMATRAATAPEHGRRPAPLFTAVVDYDVFAGRMCELASRVPVTPGSLVPWLDEAYVERVVFDGKGRLLDVGPRRRLFRGGLRRGIQVRDRGCWHPLCDQPPEVCQVDHIEPYAEGGETTAGNGRLACGFHNRLRNTHPRPEWPETPDADDAQADDLVETDPVSTNEPADDAQADDLVETDPVLTNEPGDDGEERS